MLLLDSVHHLTLHANCVQRSRRVSITGHIAGEKPTSYFRIFDDETFEVKDSVMLDVNESGCSVASVKFADDPNAYFCIGTAYVLPMEEEPSRGRILVVHCTDGKAQIVAEKETKGAVFTLNPIQVCFNR